MGAKESKLILPPEEASGDGSSRNGNGSVPIQLADARIKELSRVLLSIVSMLGQVFLEKALLPVCLGFGQNGKSDIWKAILDIILSIMNTFVTFKDYELEAMKFNHYLVNEIIQEIKISQSCLTKALKKQCIKRNGITIKLQSSHNQEFQASINLVWQILEHIYAYLYSAITLENLSYFIDAVQNDMKHRIVADGNSDEKFNLDRNQHDFYIDNNYHHTQKVAREKTSKTIEFRNARAMGPSNFNNGETMFEVGSHNLNQTARHKHNTGKCVISNSKELRNTYDPKNLQFHLVISNKPPVPQTNALKRCNSLETVYTANENDTYANDEVGGYPGFSTTIQSELRRSAGDLPVNSQKQHISDESYIDDEYPSENVYYSTDVFSKNNINSLRIQECDEIYNASKFRASSLQRQHPSSIRNSHRLNTSKLLPPSQFVKDIVDDRLYKTNVKPPAYNTEIIPANFYQKHFVKHTGIADSSHLTNRRDKSKPVILESHPQGPVIPPGCKYSFTYGYPNSQHYTVTNSNSNNNMSTLNSEVDKTMLMQRFLQRKACKPIANIVQDDNKNWTPEISIIAEGDCDASSTGWLISKNHLNHSYQTDACSV